MEMKKEKVKRYQITLKPNIAYELDKMADEWGTTRSGMIATLIKLKKEEELNSFNLKKGI